MASVTPSSLNFENPTSWVFTRNASTLAACSCHSRPSFEAFFMPYPPEAATVFLSATPRLETPFQLTAVIFPRFTVTTTCSFQPPWGAKSPSCAK